MVTDLPFALVVQALELSPITFNRVLRNDDNGKILILKSSDTSVEGVTKVCLELANERHSSMFCSNMDGISSPIAIRVVTG